MLPIAAPTIHLSASYWSMVLVGLHLGMHGRPVNRALAGCRKTARAILLTAGIAFTAFGLVAFFQNGIAPYLTMSTPFAHFESDKNPLLIVAENVTMTGLFAFVSCQIMELVRNKSGEASRSLQSTEQSDINEASR